MTKEAFTPTPVYIVSGVGPYAIEHPFAEANDLVVQLRDDSATIILANSEFTAENTGDRGSLTLTATAAAAYDGWRMAILRTTGIEQGWEGQSAREVGLEAQLDLLTMALQDAVQRTLGTAFRLPIGEETAVLPAAPDRVGMVAGFDAGGQPVLYATSITEGLFAVQRRYETLANLVADPSLQIGMMVATQGRASVGDSGHGFYRIVAEDTGAANGVTLVQLAGIKGLAELQHCGWLAIEQGGVVNGVEASAAMQATWDALVAWKDAQPNDPDITLTGHSRGTLQNQVVFARKFDGTRVDGAHLDLTGSYFTAVSGGNLGPTKHMLRIRTGGITRLGTLNGGKFAAGVDFFGMNGGRAYHVEIINFKGTGARVRGSSGSFVLNDIKAREYIQSDPEFNDQANYTAVGLSVEDGDFTCFGGNVLYCHKLYHMAPNAVGVHIVAAHPTNGNPNFKPGSEPVYVVMLAQSNGLGHSDATGGDHTVADGLFVHNGDFETHGDAWAPIAFGTYPFDRGAAPHANSPLVHLANKIKADTGRDVYVKLVAHGGRKLENWLLPETKAANGWTSNDEFTEFMYPDIRAAGVAIPGRNTPWPDVIYIQQGEANDADTPAELSAKQVALCADMRERGVFHPDTQIVIGGLVPDHPFYADFQATVALTAASVSAVSYVDSSGLTDTGDDVHFDGPSLVTLGTRAGAALTLDNLGDGAAPFADPILIHDEATRRNFFHATYFDNGVTLTNGELCLTVGHYVHNNRAVIMPPHVRIIATEADQVAEVGGYIVGLGGVGSVGFVNDPDAGTSWAGDLRGIQATYDYQASGAVVIDRHRGKVELIDAGDDPYRTFAKTAGKFVAQFRSGNQLIEQSVDPATGVQTTSAQDFRVYRQGQTNRVLVGAGGVGFGEVAGEGGKLEMWAGDAQRWHIQNGGTMRPHLDNTHNLGGAARRVAEAFVRALRPGSGAPIWTAGTGSPEGALAAPVGSLYLAEDGGAGSTAWIKESGTGNTGWVGIGAAGGLPAGLASIGGLTVAADRMLYTTGSNTFASTALTARARALLTAADGDAALKAIGAPVFASRADLVAWWATNHASVPTGALVHDGTVFYRKVAASAAIADLTNLVAAGDWFADHMAANLVPDTTDMSAAVAAVLAVSDQCHFLNATYRIASQVVVSTNRKALAGHGEASRLSIDTADGVSGGIWFAHASPAVPGNKGPGNCEMRGLIVSRKDGDDLGASVRATRTVNFRITDCQFWGGSPDVLLEGCESTEFRRYGNSPINTFPSIQPASVIQTDWQYSDLSRVTGFSTRIYESALSSSTASDEPYEATILNEASDVMVLSQVYFGSSKIDILLRPNAGGESVSGVQIADCHNDGGGAAFIGNNTAIRLDTTTAGAGDIKVVHLTGHRIQAQRIAIDVAEGADGQIEGVEYTGGLVANTGENILRVRGNANGGTFFARMTGVELFRWGRDYIDNENPFAAFDLDECAGAVLTGCDIDAESAIVGSALAEAGANGAAYFRLGGACTIRNMAPASYPLIGGTAANFLLTDLGEDTLYPEWSAGFKGPLGSITSQRIGDFTEDHRAGPFYCDLSSVAGGPSYLGAGSFAQGFVHRGNASARIYTMARTSNNATHFQWWIGYREAATGIVTWREMSAGRAAFVADADGTDLASLAGSIDALRDALVTARMMAAS